jgi:glycosyltransferase involved in cell wall biosynthesis
VTIYSPAFESQDFGDLAAGLDIRIVQTSRQITHFTGKKSKGFSGWISSKVRHEREFISVSKEIARAMDPDFDGINLQDSAYRVGYYYKKRNPSARVVWTVNGVPFAYLARGKFLYDLLGKSYQLVKQRTTKKFMDVVDEAAVLANNDVHWLDELSVKHVSVVRAGLDFEKFFAPVKDIAQRAQEKRINLLALGALNFARRYDNVLEAVKILRDGGYRPHLTIVANNIWNEDAHRDALIAYVKDNHLEELVTLKFDGVPEAELPKVYAASDVFIHAVYVPPPGHHGWGLVNFEAMAAGLAVVLCDSSTATEVLHDGVDVLLTKPLASQEIAEKIKFCIDHPEEYKKIAHAGQEVARGMRWEKYAEGMLELFRGK